MLLTISIVACSRAPTTSPMITARLVLNGPAGGQQAGFFYGRALGYYAEDGLDVAIDEGHGSLDAVQRVARGEADFAFADPAAIETQGGRVTLVSTLFQDTPYAILSLESQPITSPAALRGTTIGAQPGSTARTLLAQLEANIVDVDPADFARALRLGQVAGVVGRRDVESLLLRHAGEAVVELPFAQLGVHAPGLSLAASDETIRRDPEVVVRFVRSSLRGWDAARQTPRAAGRAVVEQFLAGYEEQIVEQLTADLPLLCAAGNDRLGIPQLGEQRFVPVNAPRCRT